MDFASVAWWAYGIVALCGILFGLLQSLLMRKALMGETPRKWLYAVKLGLWGVILVILAVISLPLLVAFVPAASVTMLAGSVILYRKAQREAR